MLIQGCTSHPCIERKSTFADQNQHSWVYYSDDKKLCPSPEKLNFEELESRLKNVTILSKKMINNPFDLKVSCPVPRLTLDLLLIKKEDLNKALSQGFLPWSPKANHELKK